MKPGHRDVKVYYVNSFINMLKGVFPVPWSLWINREILHSRPRAFRFVRRRAAGLGFFFLNAGEVVAQILDELAHGHFVAVLGGGEDGSPNGHIGGAVGRDRLAKADDAGDVFVGEFSVVALGESGEVRRRRLKRGSSRA